MRKHLACKDYYALNLIKKFNILMQQIIRSQLTTNACIALAKLYVMFYFMMKSKLLVLDCIDF